MRTHEGGNKPLQLQSLGGKSIYLELNSTTVGFCIFTHTCYLRQVTLMVFSGKRNTVNNIGVRLHGDR